MLGLLHEQLARDRQREALRCATGPTVTKRPMGMHRRRSTRAVPQRQRRSGAAPHALDPAEL
jgi:hypothetical protein